MQLIPELTAENQPAKFKLKGFPEESALQSALESYYHQNPGTDRRFVVDNMFAEMIFSGSMDERGQVAELTSHERPRENFKKS